MKTPWNVEWTPFKGNIILSRYIYNLYPSTDKESDDHIQRLWTSISCPHRSSDGKLMNISLDTFYCLRDTNHLKSKLIHEFKSMELHQELYKVALHPSRLEWIF